MAEEDPKQKHHAPRHAARRGQPDTPRHRRDRHDQQPATEADSAGEDAAAPKPGVAEDDVDAMAVDESRADRLASLEAELEEARDRALRSRAEMENFKKRLGRQVEEERRYALLPMMHDLLPVLDNMDRAIEAAGDCDNGEGLLEGFCMVAQQLRAALAKYDCKEIEALHKPFDPNRHQAVSQQATDEFPANTVMAVVETGYQLHDRVVRPSKVIVSTKPEEQQTTGESPNRGETSG